MHSSHQHMEYALKEDTCKTTKQVTIDRNKITKAAKQQQNSETITHIVSDHNGLQLKINKRNFRNV